MLVKVTVRAVVRATKIPAEQYLWDTRLKGFGVRVSPSGSVSWILQKRFGGRGGRAIRYVLGNSPSMSLVQARAQAEIDIGEMRKGTHLVDRRRRARDAIKTKLTGLSVRQALDLYIKQNTTHNRYWKEQERRFRKAVIPVIGYKLLTDVTKQDIKEVMARLKKDRRGIFSAIRVFMRWALQEDYITSDPTASIAPPKAPKDRDRFLKDAEIKAVWQACDLLGYPWCQFYKLSLLTGQRRGEVAGMSWSEIDLQKRTWTIPRHRAKNKKAHIVHLTDLAISVLQSTPHTSGFVLTVNQTGQITGYSDAKAALDELSGVRNWVAHDFRRTIVTHMAELGISTDVADRILNHVSGSNSGVKGIYQRYQFIKERKEALEKWSAYLSEIA